MTRARTASAAATAPLPAAILARAILAAIILAPALAGCATTAPAGNRDVVAVVQDEQGRQAAGEAAHDGQTAEQALSHATDPRQPTPEAPPR